MEERIYVSCSMKRSRGSLPVNSGRINCGIHSVELLEFVDERRETGQQQLARGFVTVFEFRQ